MTRFSIIALLSLLLAGCVTTGTTPYRTTAIVCPPLVGWSKADEAAAAEELKKLPAGHPLRKLAVVVVKQRNLIRACKQSNKGAKTG